jgi:hypothetical protein
MLVLYLYSVNGCRLARKKVHKGKKITNKKLKNTFTSLRGHMKSAEQDF